MSDLIQIRVRAFQGAQVDAARKAQALRELLPFEAPDRSYFVSHEQLVHLRSSGFACDLVREIPSEQLPVRFLSPLYAALWDTPPESARLAVLARLLAEERADGSVDVRFLGRDRVPPPGTFVQDRPGGRRHYVWETVPAGAVSASKMADRFPAIRSLLLDPRSRIVLALGSGGLKLFAHAPALRLLDALGCTDRIAEVWGASAGAVAGLLYSHGLSPHAIEQTGYDLYGGRHALELRPSRLQFLRQILRDALLPSAHMNGAGFVDCRVSLGRLIAQYCTAPRPRRPFFCTAFDLARCRSQVLTSEPVPPHLLHLLLQTDAREAALASAAVPLLFVPHEIEGTPYIDGSTTGDVPLFQIVQKWDLDRAAGIEKRARLVVIFVRLGTCLEAYRPAGSRIGKLRLLQTVAAAGVDAMHRRDIELIARRPDVELVGLELRDDSPEFFDAARIPHILRSAKERFPLQLEAIESELREHSDSGGPVGAPPPRYSRASLPVRRWTGRTSQE